MNILISIEIETLFFNQFLPFIINCIFVKMNNNEAMEIIRYFLTFPIWKNFLGARGRVIELKLSLKFFPFRTTEFPKNCTHKFLWITWIQSWLKFLSCQKMDLIPRFSISLYSSICPIWKDFNSTIDQFCSDRA